MRYPPTSLGITGEPGGVGNRYLFTPWQPSSWPEENLDKEGFIKTLKIIFEESLLNEIDNVIKDAEQSNGGLEHRGHVIALALFCSIDALSSYSVTSDAHTCSLCGRGDSVGPRYQKYIVDFFPDDYKPHATALYRLYRNNLTHSWNLFEAALSPDNISIQETENSLLIGLPNLFEAVEESVARFVERLKSDPKTEAAARKRYAHLRKQAANN